MFIPQRNYLNESKPSALLGELMVSLGEGEPSCCRGARGVPVSHTQDRTRQKHLLCF